MLRVNGSVAVASWQVWALMSAAFAAMTAIFAKLGVEQFNPDAATLIRTVVILIVLTGVVAATHQLPALAAGSPRTYAFLVLSGLATDRKSTRLNSSHSQISYAV